MAEHAVAFLAPPIDEALLRAHPELAVLTLDLPDSDGEPMDNERAGFQIRLILDSLGHQWRDRHDFYSGGNMFLYYSVTQALQVIAEVHAELVEERPPLPPSQKAFRGPDVFVVRHVDGTYRRQKWVVWEEGGRYPDVIFEFLSTSTARSDKTRKKMLYEQVFRTPEYYWYDPFDPTVLEGWRIGTTGQYEPIMPDARGWLWSQALELWVGRWEGTYQHDTTTWVRLYDPEGKLVYTLEEAAQQQADAERARADAERQRADTAEAALAQVRAEIAQLQGHNR